MDAPAVHLDHKPNVSPTHDGEHSDRCPVDGCAVVDAGYALGGNAPQGEYFRWSQFHAPCGASWTRTGAQVAEERERRGLPVQYKTKSAGAGRVTSTPSAAYQRGYEKIRWDQ